MPSNSSKSKRKTRSAGAEEAHEMVSQTIGEVVAANPRAAKFFNQTPASIAAKAKAIRKASSSTNSATVTETAHSQPAGPSKHTQPNPKPAEGLEQQLDNGNLSDISELSSMTSSPPHPRKRVKSTHIETETEIIEPEADIEIIEPEAEIITFFCNVIKPPSSAPARGRKPTKPKEEYEEKNPFTLETSATFSSLLVAISCVVGCSAVAIDHNLIRWKRQNAAATAKPLILGGEIGFKSLVLQMKAQKPAGRVVMLYMPKFTSIAAEPTDDNMDIPALGTSTELGQQIATFDDQLRVYLNELNMKYPMGTHPSFPTKQVYVQPGTGYIFELTYLRKSCWANAMVKQRSDAPPHSSHFDVGHRIRTIPAAPAPVPVSVPAPIPAPAPATPAGGILANIGLGGSNLTDLLTLGLMNQMFSGGCLPRVPSSILAASGPQPTVPSLPPSPSKVGVSVDVPLEEFCRYYNISDEHRGKLQRLGYKPGDANILKVPDSKWEEEEYKVPFLSVMHMKDSHKRFVLDVRGGVWDRFREDGF
ncbi:hypothetical protein BT96DRAFT_1026783 [Gymnopus androsaceus JB14]|uniref:Uncharacterized protein n=1 Tax=Gymnopus androsaceus JB14 TaxID=1447944 RepID=A0A6A4GH83_9AGAR|nr:hypothetical protein BT96DRAFT_1026783 [Gymnopus androsaceus JB14]